MADWVNILRCLALWLVHHHDWVNMLTTVREISGWGLWLGHHHDWVNMLTTVREISGWGLWLGDHHDWVNMLTIPCVRYQAEVFG